MKKKTCLNCKTAYSVDNYRFEESKYCSNSCRYEHWKENNVSETFCEFCGKILIRPKSKLKEHNYCTQKCKNSDVNHLKRLSESMKNSDNPSWGKYWQHCNKGKINSPTTIFKKGEENPNWKGGTSKKRGDDWKEQREKALLRDNNTCTRCGCNENLHAHHIEKYSETKNNELDNLITLCRRCHLIHERGYSTLVINGEDIIIKHVPEKCYDLFIEFSNEEFDGNLAMTLKHLMDFYFGLIPKGTEHVETQVEILTEELNEIKKMLVSKKDEKEYKIMANGVKLPIKG